MNSFISCLEISSHRRSKWFVVDSVNAINIGHLLSDIISFSGKIWQRPYSEEGTYNVCWND